MCFCFRKWATYFTVACFFFCGGVEYGIILPTALDYLTLHFHAEPWMFGLSLSAFSLSNLFSGPILGFVYDRTRAVRIIVLVANLFEIGGNFMYFVASSPWMVVGSRLLTGLGAGAGASIFGHLARTSSKKDRTAVFSVFMAARQVGMVFGPGMNFFLRYSNFYIGPFIVDKYTAPGAFMVIVWCVMEAMFLFFFYNLPIIIDNQDVPVNDNDSPLHRQQQLPNHDSIGNAGVSAVSLNAGDINNSLSRSVAENVSETKPLLKRTPAPDANRSKQPGLRKYMHLLLSEILREHMVVLLAIFTIILFNQTAIETLVVPIGEQFLNWGLRDLSIFYMVAGAVILSSFLATVIISRKISDRWLIVIGFTCTLISYIWMTGCVAVDYSRTSQVFMTVSFIAGGAVLLVGLPMLMVAGSSLFSKLIPQSIQGFGQGFRRSMGSIAAILGPLWASSTYPISLYITFGVILGLLLFILLMTLLSFKKLKEPSSQDGSQNHSIRNGEA